MFGMEIPIIIYNEVFLPQEKSTGPTTHFSLGAVGHDAVITGTLILESNPPLPVLDPADNSHVDPGKCFLFKCAPPGSPVLI
jgi:hypothetical protein